MLYLPKQTTHKGGILIKSITQDIKYYQAIALYGFSYYLTGERPGTGIGLHPLL